MKTIRINIGCGRDYKDDWENIDISKEVEAEHYLDIQTEKLPFADSSVTEIYCSGVLEQIRDNEDMVFALNECHRVLKKDGQMTVIVPNAQYAICNKDIWDVRRFLPETFSYIHKDSKEYTLYGSVYGFLPWNVFSVNTNNRGILTALMIKYVQT